MYKRQVWDSEILEDDNGQYIKLSYLSKDGEENYPGNLNVNVEYRLTDENELVINYFAKSDKDTICLLYTSKKVIEHFGYHTIMID